MKVIVTGGAGFIGSHLVDRLLAEGHTVTAVDNFDPFYDPRIKKENVSAHGGHPKYSFHALDIRDIDRMRHELAGGYDCIIHLAARAGVRPSIQDPIAYQEVNVGGTQNMLELAREWKTGQFVFGSSSSVYGVNPNIPWREEDHVLMPISPYASTKISGELLGHVYSHLFGIRFIALRFFTVYGPRQRPDLAIHKFIRLMSEGNPIPFFGDGSSSRDYTYVSDAVSALLNAVTYRKKQYDVFNIGNDRPVTLGEMVAVIERTLGKPALLTRLDDQSGDVPRTWACIEKARASLGYSPEVDFSEGVSRFASWYLRREAPVSS
jgi:UDP-glucuronate 4-epimerase